MDTIIQYFNLLTPSNQIEIFKRIEKIIKNKENIHTDMTNFKPIKLKNVLKIYNDPENNENLSGLILDSMENPIVIKKHTLKGEIKDLDKIDIEYCVNRSIPICKHALKKFNIMIEIIPPVLIIRNDFKNPDNPLWLDDLTYIDEKTQYKVHLGFESPHVFTRYYNNRDIGLLNNDYNICESNYISVGNVYQPPNYKNFRFKSLGDGKFWLGNNHPYRHLKFIKCRISKKYEVIESSIAMNISYLDSLELYGFTLHSILVEKFNIYYRFEDTRLASQRFKSL
jgi:hypothetical protein